MLTQPLQGLRVGGIGRVRHDLVDIDFGRLSGLPVLLQTKSFD